MYNDDEEQEEGPKSSFTTYLAEGDVLFKQAEYKKALDSYNLALELQPTEKSALVARSKCHLQLGDSEAALKDAESALVDDKEFIRALYQKAEALYSMGDFEHALVFYHRGNKLRPEQQEFRLGIQKAQEAIDNSIGRAAKIKLESKGDLSFFAKQDEVKKPKGYVKPKASNRNNQQHQTNRGKNTKPPGSSAKTVKKLLGELYADKQYLENLMNDKGFVQGSNDGTIYSLISNGITYLDSRTEFWRQQKPLYARKKQKPLPHRNKPKNSKTTDFVLRSLEDIDQKLTNGDNKGSLKQAEDTLRQVKAMNDQEISNKQEVIANLHSCIGNALLEMDDPTKALENHQRDLSISRKIKSEDGISRALDNIGRCHARLSQFGQAINSWMEKLPLSKSALETTWLQHEIGRCYLEQKNYRDALDCGQQSLASAKEAQEKVWELNATVLIAQSQVKLGELTMSLTSFQNARGIAECLDDKAAEMAIGKAIDDVRNRIETGIVDDDTTTTRDNQGTTSTPNDTEERTVETSEPRYNDDDQGTERDTKATADNTTNDGTAAYEPEENFSVETDTS